jgi:hypothetical protein
VTDPDDSDDRADERTDAEREAAGLPPSPRIGGAGQRSRAPKPVEVSFALWVISAVVLALGFGLLLGDSDGVTERLIAGNPDPQVTADAIAAGVATLLWTLFIGGVVFGALFVLFAYKAREGTRSARSVLTVLVVVLAVFQWVIVTDMAGAVAAGVIALAIVLACIAVVLMYLPSVAGYFPPLPRTRRKGWRSS